MAVLVGFVVGVDVYVCDVIGKSFGLELDCVSFMVINCLSASDRGSMDIPTVMLFKGSAAEPEDDGDEKSVSISMSSRMF